MKHILIPGSFDPVTLGHLSLFERASAMFEKVTVAVMHNREKQYLFTPEERAAFIRAGTEHLNNVEVVTSDEMLFEFCARTGYFHILKGIRNAEDLAYENLQADWNHDKDPRIETIYLPSRKELEGISSTSVRNNLERGQSIREFTGPVLEKLIKQAYDTRHTERRPDPFR